MRKDFFKKKKELFHIVAGKEKDGYGLSKKKTGKK